MSSNLKILDELFHEWEVGYLVLAIQIFKTDGLVAEDRLRKEWAIKLTQPQVTALFQLADVL